MKKSNKKIRWEFIIPIILIGLGGMVFLKGKEVDKIKIEAWNNIYNENNIQMYYGESEEQKIQQLNKVYDVKEIASTEQGEIDKILKVIDIVNRIVEFDDVMNSKKLNGYDILQEKGELKKVSQMDMAIIARDLILANGFKARSGEFKSVKGNSYFIVEYWSEEYNKWVMVDFRDRGYVEVNGTPISAIEVFNESNKEMKYIGKTSSKVFLKELKKKSETYSVSIDNTVSREKSNSVITYVMDKKYISINYNKMHIPPTIFTENSELFEVNPRNDKIGEDDKAYIILMKKEKDKNETEEVTENYIVGGFKNSKIMDKYYIKHNNGNYESVKKYYPLELVSGNNIIEISLDGINTVGSIKIKYEE